MAKVITKHVQVVERSLALNEEEIALLVFILRRIGGPRDGARGIAEGILDVLEPIDTIKVHESTDPDVLKQYVLRSESSSIYFK